MFLFLIVVLWILCSFSYAACKLGTENKQWGLIHFLILLPAILISGIVTLIEKLFNK
jgi:hypothetical protein